jgi:hypothetical protein
MGGISPPDAILRPKLRERFSVLVLRDSSVNGLISSSGTSGSVSTSADNPTACSLLSFKLYWNWD